MKVEIRRISGALFQAKNDKGQSMLMDGPEKLGGKDIAMRPMETLLSSLAGCSAMDIVMIIEKGRHQLDSIDIQVEAKRKDEVPAVFETIHLHFTASGDFSEKVLKRACELSMQKYCSVAKMLAPTVEISHSYTLNN